MKVKFTNSNKCFEIIKRYVGIIALTISLMLFNATLKAQSLGLNQPTPDASSILDAVATDRGVLIPRVALTATNAVGPIAAPADALLVYNTATAGGAGVNVTPGFYYYNTATTAWIRLFSGGGSPGVRWDQIVDPGAGLTLSHGTNATIFNFANVATTGFAMNATALTAGKLLSLTSSNAAATGNVLHVSSNSTGALAAGGILFDFTANHTGVGFEVDDVTTAGSVMKMNANSLVGGIGLDIVSTATGLTGRLQSIQLTGDNAGNTNASNLLYIGSSGASSVSKGLTVDLASTGALAAGGVLFNFANHTGFGVNLVDVTTAGTAMSILTNDLAGGTGLSIASSSTGNNFTGNLASITLSGNNVGNTGDLLELNSSGATSIAKALNVQVASTGNFSTTGAVAFNFSAAHTGSAFRIDDATQTGKVLDIVGSGVTTGRLLDVSTTGNTWTGNGTTNGLATISSSSTAGTAAGSSVLLQLTRTGANANNPHTAYGLYSEVTNTNATAGTNTAGYFTASGTAAITTNYGAYSTVTGAGASNIAGYFEATGAGTNNYALNIGTMTGGATNNIQINTGTLTAIAGATNNQINLGSITNVAVATSKSIATGAISGAGTATYGVDIGTNTSTATTNYGVNIGAISGGTAAGTNYGMYIGAVTAAGTTNWGLYIAAPANATTYNYAIDARGTIIGALPCVATALANTRDDGTDDFFAFVAISQPSTNRVFIRGTDDGTFGIAAIDNSNDWDADNWNDLGQPNGAAAPYIISLSCSVVNNNPGNDDYAGIIFARTSDGKCYFTTTINDGGADTTVDNVAQWGNWVELPTGTATSPSITTTGGM